MSETPHRTEAFGGGQLIRWRSDLHPSPPPGSKLLRFEQYTSTRLLAQFDEDLPQIQKISMRISTGNVIGPRYKIRLVRVRFTPLERPDRWGHTPETATQAAGSRPPPSSPQVADVSL